MQLNTKLPPELQLQLPPPAKRRRYQSHQNRVDDKDKPICNNLLNIRIRIDEVIPKEALESG